jgi:4-hydroxythreonine-4-phosphate dehydrogenase
MSLPKIAITIGDPSGIGPEVTAKAVSSQSVRRICIPLIIGSRAVFSGRPGVKLPKDVRFIDIPADLDKCIPGRSSATSGRAAYEYISQAVETIKNKEAASLVTAPISKAAFMLAGVPYTGHTELLAALTGVKRCAMLMVSGDFRTVMVTRHLPLAEVSKNLSIEKISEAVTLAEGLLKTGYKIKKPKILVFALNPHAGESGMLGREENGIIAPAVRYLREKGMDITGPVPADSAWIRILRGEFDLGAAMYHDPAMIGLKCAAPGKVVNITAGLPFIRTSPGHGTGFDIAGKNIADAGPMIEAIKTAVNLIV